MEMVEQDALLMPDGLDSPEEFGVSAAEEIGSRAPQPDLPARARGACL